MSYGPPPQNPYQGGQPGWPPPAPYRDDEQATTAMVLGILGIAVCGLVAPFAWSIGRASMNRIDASGGQLGGRSRAQVGYILGIVGTAELVLGLVVTIAFFATFAGTVN